MGNKELASDLRDLTWLDRELLNQAALALEAAEVEQTPVAWAQGWTGNGVVNFAGGAFIKVRRDGEWMIVHCRSGGVETTLSLRDHQAFEIAYALTPELNSRFERARTAEKALYELQAPQVQPSDLRTIADELDCGADCEGHGRIPCRRDEKDGTCGWRNAEDLRTLASAIERHALGTTHPEKAEQTPVAWDELRIQAVYAILCDTTEPPAGEHWEGFAARRIVTALRPARTHSRRARGGQGGAAAVCR